jgi:hypothetical protein
LNLAQNMDKRRALVNTVMNNLFNKLLGFSFSVRATAGFSKRTLLHIFILSCVGWDMRRIGWVMVRMTGFISTLVTNSLNHI